MLTRQIAVISQTPAAEPGPVAAATAAIQKQVLYDLAPAWQTTAIVSYFPTLNDMPDGYWPVVIRATTGVPAAGAHVSRDGQTAFAIVAYRPEDWTVTLSHEILEMLIDPFGTEFIKGPAPDGSGSEVQYLAEVCDPCQGAEPDVTFAYQIDGILVSDFVFRSYYKALTSGIHSFAGNVTAPRQLLPWGYYTWKDPLTGDWSWRYAEDSTETTEFLGPIPPLPDIHLRGFIDRKLDHRFAEKGRRAACKGRRNAMTARTSPLAARKLHATWWQSEIDAVAGTS